MNSLVRYIRNLRNNYFDSEALVLMYHRIAEPESDIWDIAVSPSNFEQHLQVLKKAGNIIPLKELAASVKQNKIKKNSIAITFDDGYADNYLMAKPLLEKYNLPATFFITASNIGLDNEFWWDELENLILFTEYLPASISMNIGGNLIEYNLKEETHLDGQQRKINRSWKACMAPPPSLRCELLLILWQHLKPLPYAEQQQQLQKLRKWASYNITARPDYKSMTLQQLHDLTKNNLFDIGAHTVSHPSLNCHNLQYQTRELLESKIFLQAVKDQEVNLLAYPYGNYNKETIIAATETAFEAAFTTEEKVVTKKSNIYQMGRFQVNNLSSKEFKTKLKQWKHIK